ncbi:TIGR03915 family putative DNA repair protein [Maribacter antarcticus]|uniref:TIGR03915 family putative DNA repair protein n=1 Tax=Maribacter antarcticus TaxID=505250 RepID=UPI000AC07E64|nr:TIGR03915 family putative DNA repair protein [Maribacter antarcticus]
METIEEPVPKNMEYKSKIFSYDGSFNGFLTAVFIAFEYKLIHVDIQPTGRIQNGLFTETETIFTNIDKAKRVWNGIRNRNYTASKNIYFAFLSEQRGIEPLLYSYIRKLMNHNEKSTAGFSSDCFLRINQLAHKVAKKKRHVEAKLDFQLTRDAIYFAQIAPDFNVLPLLSKHFRSQYANKPWIIYDTKRNYGLYYNLSGVEVIGLDLTDSFLNQIISNETIFNVEMGNSSFENLNIKSHISLKLYHSYAPKRNSNYISEKQAS